ncbi:MAG TPA: hypothetical protein VIV15_13305 [Anaerolineales bacterium]
MTDEKEFNPQFYGQALESAVQKGNSARKDLLLNLICALIRYNITSSGEHY